MTRPTSERPPVAAARSLAGAVAGRFSLDEYCAAPSAPDRVMLCPSGESLDGDLAFLRAVRRRLLWPAPPPDIAAAVAGLVTDAPANRGRAGTRRAGSRSSALLLEGTVTSERARAALESPERLWIVESARHVLLSGAELDALARVGVRWAALRPVQVEGVLAGAALFAARSRWRRLVPGGRAVRPTSPGGESRRPSRR